jgi:hypothetical protein
MGFSLARCTIQHLYKAAIILLAWDAIELCRCVGSSSTVRIDSPFSNELSGSFIYILKTANNP